jgi:tRNA/tmRNA/rRNA uracil-C5-methylase (TrmA/RlmC/RlmD family)
MQGHMTEVELLVERPAPGGRMIARHEGRVVFVAGAIPGERVRARLERPRGGTLFATTVEVIDPSPDRRDPGADPACGGRDFAHIAIDRQRALKAEIVVDAFRRLARVSLDMPPVMHVSPEEGWRMRARLHVAGGDVGFYREATHELCDAACSRQLRDDTTAVVHDLGHRLARHCPGSRGSLELAENREASERAALLDLSSGVLPAAAVDDILSVAGLTGVGLASHGRLVAERGSPVVIDVIDVVDARLRLQRHVRGFFQGNRFLLGELLARVLSHVPAGPLLDLYAGVGLFGLGHAALGRGHVLAVEGDATSAVDLTANAAPFGDAVEVVEASVESLVSNPSALAGRTVIVDPPRTGLSPAVSQALAAARPPRIVYVSCDVATLARDVGRLTAVGYSTRQVEAFDLFPATAHVETLAVLAL